MISLRKLVAFDMAAHGTRFIVAEFTIGVLGITGLGLFSLLRHGTLMGWVLIGIGLNYLPLLLHAVSLARRGSAKQEAAYELAHLKSEAKKYGLGQSIILVPFVLLLIAPYQLQVKKSRA